MIKMKTKDLSQGSPTKSLLLFAIPMILSVTLQQIYNIADSSIAGNMIGSDALASVSASYPITMIYLAIATGLGVGSGVIVSRYFGEKNYEYTKTSIYTSLIFTAIVALIVSILGILITNASLGWISTPSNIFDDSSIYLKFYCGGLLFTFLYNVITCIFQSLGNSKTPLYFLAFSTVLNVALDILFVGPCHLKVMGLALGTFIAQGIAMTLSLIFLVRDIKKNLKTEGKVKIFDFKMLNNIQSIAIPSIIQGSAISLGNFFIQRNINSYGSDLIAGYGASYKLCYVIVNIFTAYSNAVSNFTSQNIGAGKPKRVYEALKSSLIINLAFAIVMSLILVFTPKLTLSIFMDSNVSQNALNYGISFIDIVAPFFLILAIKMPFDGILKGSKDMIGFMIGTVADLVVRIILSYALSYNFGYKGIFVSWPIGWAVGMICCVTCFVLGRWKKINHISKESLSN